LPAILAILKTQKGRREQSSSIRPVHHGCTLLKNKHATLRTFVVKTTRLSPEAAPAKMVRADQVCLRRAGWYAKTAMAFPSSPGDRVWGNGLDLVSACFVEAMATVGPQSQKGRFFDCHWKHFAPCTANKDVGEGS
jgi:hypothetical protein